MAIDGSGDMRSGFMDMLVHIKAGSATLST
jgi:hypothetical protein